ncbi:hypothetical protein QFC19_007789 [Naganishia cerealis]|uniref:Uncharacterized protein n=1 Tax=Naganishia cerealis TaxID=610337 RepID=A0ACC2V7J1_9TREE|nr:hypothetical protein QFC19_007789 [Naganishia cerealis]
MSPEYIEIDSDSDNGLPTTKSRSAPPTKTNTRFTAVAAVSSSFGSNDIAWDTLDDGWIDKILREEAAGAQAQAGNNVPSASHDGTRKGDVVDLSASRTPSPAHRKPSSSIAGLSIKYARDHLAHISEFPADGLSSSPITTDPTLQALISGNSRGVAADKGKRREIYLSPAAIPVKQSHPQRSPPTQSSQIELFTSPSVLAPPRIQVSPVEVEVLNMADSPVALTKTRDVLALAGPSIQPNDVLFGKFSRSATEKLGNTSEDGDTDEDSYALDFSGANKDKGKRRADDAMDKDDLFEALCGDVVRPAKSLKRTRTSIDGLSLPTHNRSFGATKSMSAILSAGETSMAGITAAEKKAESARSKAIKAEEAERSKAQKALQKEREKQRALAEKEAKKKDAEVNKLRSSKSETVREVTVHISAELEHRGSPLATALPLLRERLAEKNSSMLLIPVPESEDPAQCDQVDGSTMHVPGLVKVKRWVTAEFDREKRRFVALKDGDEYWQDQLPYVIVITAKDLVVKIVAGKYDKSNGLVAWLNSMKRKLGLTRSATDIYASTPVGAAPASVPGSQTSRCEIMLMIHGMKAYYSKSNSAKRKEFSDKVRNHMTGQGAQNAPEGAAGRSAQDGSSEEHMPDKEEVEKELVRLQLIHRCFQVCATDLSIQSRSSLQQYRHIQNSHLPFSTRDLPKKGDGPYGTFKLMLEEITGVTESGAEGIADQWKSFRTLMEEYEHMERRKEKGEIGQKQIEGMLANCVVKALTTGVANARPLGMNAPT